MEGRKADDCLGDEKVVRIAAHLRGAGRMASRGHRLRISPGVVGRSGARAWQLVWRMPRPYDLRHSFASLLLHEGRSVIYVARQLGHDARLTLTRYGHVIDELEDAPRLEAEAAIANARLASRPRW
jgi:integrase